MKNIQYSFCQIPYFDPFLNYRIPSFYLQGSCLPALPELDFEVLFLLYLSEEVAIVYSTS